MFFRRQRGEYRETDRVTRYKLIKSGKHWLRASTSLFGLFKVMRGGVDATQVKTELVEDQASQKLTALDLLKGVALRCQNLCLIVRQPVPRLALLLVFRPAFLIVRHSASLSVLLLVPANQQVDRMFL